MVLVWLIESWSVNFTATLPAAILPVDLADTRASLMRKMLGAVTESVVPVRTSGVATVAKLPMEIAPLF